MSASNPTAAEEIAALVAWAASYEIPGTGLILGDYLVAMPPFSYSSVDIMKSQTTAGISQGLPSLQLLIPIWGHHGLFIEMLRRKNAVEPPQKVEMIQRLHGAGYVVRSCRGWDSARQELLNYLKCHKQQESAA